ncbi:MAG: preprotein translocase subunit SecE [Candidatus Dormibacteraeota bacterium]|nr:preprotein translocase subunit SecE [Candidatus Dormibacteraeota bacterium]MDQ6884919.1 preprotein translocase subunit SecE [Candidatus Dormibacteraeota bacterium]
MARAIPTEPRPTNKVQRAAPAPRRGIIRGFEDIINELRKVIWPSWAELRTMTFVVIVTVVVVSLLLGLIDYLLAHSLVKIEFPRG